ncbi:MAG: hypothetical protein JSU82_07185 [Rhodospirillales bacterium]|nr:MAG: hypothetical protein JSU82_07185 [Rhodospirillales bacterium]
MRTTIIPIALMMALAGCASSGVTLSQQAVRAAYSPGQFALASAGRDTRVVIIGNPFGGDQGAFEVAVTDAMQGQHFGQPTNFTTTPGEDARLTHRVVFLFDPATAVNPARLCRPEMTEVATAPDANRITLFAAFCLEERLLTHIVGRAPTAANARDPAFRDLVGQVTNGLFPPERDRNRGRRCPPMMNC